MIMTEVTEAQLEDIKALFVQTAGSLTSDGNGQITLQGVSPSTLYFADRPQREVGHMATSRFVELWGEGENSFATDPPNAVLSFAEPAERTPEEVVATIRDPRADGNSLTYQATLPTSTGPVALFIDPFARPLRPAPFPGVGGRDASSRPPSYATLLTGRHPGLGVPDELP
jgi:hypothetical protein